MLEIRDEMTEEYADNMVVDISLENPLRDYMSINTKIFKGNFQVSDSVLYKCFKKISSAAERTVERLLFEVNGTTEKQSENWRKASALINAYKVEAAFFTPWRFNEWIVEIRDKVLEKDMLEFWRDYLVKMELGPCCLRDSDYFDNHEDDEIAAEFYNYAGCRAPWLEPDTSHNQPFKFSDVQDVQSKAVNRPGQAKTMAAYSGFKIIGGTDPVADYRHNMEIQEQRNAEAIARIMSEGKKFVNYLLFEKKERTAEDDEKVLCLLKAIKKDSSTYKPADYNVWILEVRDALHKTKRHSFWTEVIKGNNLDICFNKDCEFLDNAEDDSAEKNSNDSLEDEC